jgi:hypothetical protein
MVFDREGRTDNEGVCEEIAGRVFAKRKGVTGEWRNLRNEEIHNL